MLGQARAYWPAAEREASPTPSEGRVEPTPTDVDMSDVLQISSDDEDQLPLEHMMIATRSEPAAAETEYVPQAVQDPPRKVIIQNSRQAGRAPERRRQGHKLDKPPGALTN